MKVKIVTLVAPMIVLGFHISGLIKDAGDPPTTLEPESIESLNLQGANPVISETIAGSRPEICLEPKVQEFQGISNIKLSDVTQTIDPADSPDKFTSKSSTLDSEDLCTCPCSFSENQFNVLEERKLRTSDSESSNSSSPLKRPSKGCQELQSVNGSPLSTVQTHPDTSEPASSLYERTMNESKQFSIKLTGRKAMYQGGLNDSLVQNVRDNINNHVAVVLENRFWSYTRIIFPVLLLDGMNNFIGPTLDIGIGVVATMILAYDIPQLLEFSMRSMPTFPWLYILILMYLTVYILMFISLILKCTSRREWLSDIAAGAAFYCSTFGILSIIIGTLHPEYVPTCIGVLICLAIKWVAHRFFEIELP